MSLASRSADAKTAFWQRIFSVLGPFDLYGASGNDPLLRGRRELVVQVFRLVDYPENLQVSVAALHAITDMSESPVFASTSGSHSPHKLYSILEASGELVNVMEAFIRRLEREETEQVSLLNVTNQFDVSSIDDEGFIAAFGLANMIRLQILDFFIANVKKSGYNMAHYLLGFSSDLLKGPASVNSIRNPQEQGVQFNCLHMILELLAYGLGQPSTPIMALDHPSLGQKCYELLNVLLGHKLLSPAISSYLRGHEDFFRLQMVHFARIPVDLSDFGYTIFEFNQKAALIRGMALDLHLACVEGAWSYVKKIMTLLSKGILEEKRSSTQEGGDEEPLGVGNSLLSVHLSSVDSILDQEYLWSVPEQITEDMLASVASFIKSITKLIRLIIAAVDRIPYDKTIVTALQTRICVSVISIVCRLQANTFATHPILDAIASLNVSLLGYFRKIVENGNELAGDEVSSLLHSAIKAISRPEANVFTRCYWYSAICNGFSLIKKEAKALESLKNALKVDLVRLLQVAASDSLMPSAQADGWKTISLGFLCLLLNEFTTLTDDECVADHLFRLGFFKSFIVSLRSDDLNLINYIEPNGNEAASMAGGYSPSSNILFLWREKFALLESITLSSLGSDRLVEAGVCDYISSFKCLVMMSSGGRGAKVMGHRLISALLPVFRFIAVFSSRSSSSAAVASIKAILLSHYDLIRAILDQQQSGITSEEYMELINHVTHLISFASNSLEHYENFSPLMASLLQTFSATKFEKSHFITLENTLFAFLNNGTSGVEKKRQFISFSYDESLESLIRRAVVPLSGIAKLLDTCTGAIQAPNSVNLETSMKCIEMILIAIIISLEISGIADQDSRHCSSYIGPTLEVLNKNLMNESLPCRDKVITLLKSLTSMLKGNSSSSS